MQEGGECERQGVEKSVVLLQLYACRVFIFQRQTPRSSNLVAIPFAKEPVKKKKIRVSVPQLYQLFAGPSESNQDTVSVEMTLSLDNGFLLLHKCHVSVCLVMTLLLIFFGGNDYFYFCAVFLIVAPYSDDKSQLCVNS